jgi:hypothetical protein
MPRYGKYPLGRVAVRRRSFVICTLCVTFCGVTGAFAQTDTETPTATSANLDSEQQGEVIRRIGSMLEASYVFPKVATKCGQRLMREWEDGTFSKLASPEQFAKSLTKTLQDEGQDKHLLVRVRQVDMAW